MENFNFSVRYNLVTLSASVSADEREGKSAKMKFDVPPNATMWKGWEFIPYSIPYENLLAKLQHLLPQVAPLSVLEIFIKTSSEIGHPFGITDDGLFIYIKDRSFVQYSFEEETFSVGTLDPDAIDFCKKNQITMSMQQLRLSFFNCVPSYLVRPLAELLSKKAYGTSVPCLT